MTVFIVSRGIQKPLHCGKQNLCKPLKRQYFTYYSAYFNTPSGVPPRARIERRREFGIVKRLGQLRQLGREHFDGVFKAPVDPVENTITMKNSIEYF